MKSSLQDRLLNVLFLASDIILAGGGNVGNGVHLEEVGCSGGYTWSSVPSGSLLPTSYDVQPPFLPGVVFKHGRFGNHE